VQDTRNLESLAICALDAADPVVHAMLVHAPAGVHALFMFPESFSLLGMGVAIDTPTPRAKTRPKEIERLNFDI